MAYHCKMWRIWQWAPWFYTYTWIRYLISLSGTLGRVSEPFSTTCTTLQDEAERRVVCGERYMSFMVSTSTRFACVGICRISRKIRESCSFYIENIPSRDALPDLPVDHKNWCRTLTMMNLLRARCHSFRVWHWNTSPRLTVWCRFSTELTMGRNAST